MKTLTHSNFFQLHNSKPLCERLSKFWHSLLSFLRWPQCLAQTLWRNLKQKPAARLTSLVGPLVSLTPRIHLSLKEAWTNKRFRTGVLFLSLAPFMYWGYRFCDINERNFDWYFINNAFYLNTIRQELAGIFLALGFFIAAPQKWAFRWFAIPVVVFCVTEIWLISGYTDWKDFYQAMPDWQVLVIAATCIPAMFFSFNYLLYRKYHLKDGNTARISGILRAPGLTTEQRFRLLEQLIEEQENFNARV